MLQIKILHDTETVRYAAEEFKKYLHLMDASIETEILFDTSPDENALRLGFLHELGLDDSDVEDAMLDDVIDVRIEGLRGYIAGSNERSILMGVYEFFKASGCAFPRPGPDGDYVPQKPMANASFRFRKKADYQFRGQCIEGAVGYEHLRETVLWLPKINMNLFMIEQIVPYNYMSRWYRHNISTVPHEPEPPYEKYCEYCEQLELLIKKLGLQLHVMGHGAINEPFGVRHMVSGMDYQISEEAEKAFALVNGKRGLYGRSPFFTQACMSQEWVQDKIVNWLADYLEKKPHIDFLHFWLGDNTNNHCECEECAKEHPSDFYVQMLNKLDAILTARGNSTKIVFIMYVDTLWPPVREKLNNPDRFIMTTACSGGLGGYSAERSTEKLPDWVRNKFPVGITNFKNMLSFVDEWKPIFDGPRFIYEYYLYTSHYADPGYMSFSRQIASDVKTLCVTGFSGIMSDQTQRAYFPTALPDTIIGEFMFDTSLDTEAFIERYMQTLFGEDYKEAVKYLETISSLFDVKALQQNSSIVAQDTAGGEDGVKKAGIFGNTAVGEMIATVPAIVDAFAPTVEKNRALSNPCHAKSWDLLRYHGEYCKYLSDIYVALSKNDVSLARSRFSDCIRYLSEIEDAIHYYFDLVLFHQRTSQLIAGK